MAPGVGALYWGGGTGFAVYSGIVWLQATANNKHGSKRIPRFNMFLRSSRVNALMVPSSLNRVSESHDYSNAMSTPITGQVSIAGNCLVFRAFPGSKEESKHGKLGRCVLGLRQTGSHKNVVGDGLQ